MGCNMLVHQSDTLEWQKHARRLRPFIAFCFVSLFILLFCSVIGVILTGVFMRFVLLAVFACVGLLSALGLFAVGSVLYC